LPTPCPDCASPILVEKITKRAGKTHRCYKKLFDPVIAPV
jgi:hypothetical protein